MERRTICRNSGGLEMRVEIEDFEVIIAGYEKIADVLKSEVKKQERATNFANDQVYLLWAYINNHRPDLIKECVEYIYNLADKREKRAAREAVAAFHDEAYDLSTIDCCKNDFTPWE